MILSSSLLLKFFKFAIVGFSGVLVDFGITFILKERIRANKYLSNAIGFLTATTSNYILNRYWTFYEENKDAQIAEFSKFLGIAIIGLLLNTLVLYVMHEKWKWNFYLSKLVGIMIISIWNFFANYFYTFSAS